MNYVLETLTGSLSLNQTHPSTLTPVTEGEECIDITDISMSDNNPTNSRRNLNLFIYTMRKSRVPAPITEETDLSVS